MSECYPNIKKISNVPKEHLDTLYSEIDKWDYRDSKSQRPSRVFFKVASRPYRVSEYSNKSYPKTPIDNVLNWILSFYPNHSLFWTHFIAMAPHQRYPVHIDGYKFHQHSKRLHIPLSNKTGSYHISWQKNDQMWEPTTWSMDECSLYEFNNVVPHSAENPSDDWRINFVVDVIDTDLLNSCKDWLFEIPEKIKFMNEIEKEFQSDPDLKKWTYKSIYYNAIKKSISRNR
jgi:hypothetical protein